MTTVHAQIFHRFEEIIGESKVECISDALTDHIEKFVEGGLVQILVRRGNHIDVFYKQPDFARWWFDAYAE